MWVVGATTSCELCGILIRKEVKANLPSKGEDKIRTHWVHRQVGARNYGSTECIFHAQPSEDA